jgi:hypothetical protein
MVNKRNQGLGSLVQAGAQLVQNLQVDYSYNQWRYAQMQQLDKNYTSFCEREFKNSVSEQTS